MSEEKECTESENKDDEKEGCNYNPAGNTTDKDKEDNSGKKTDEFGKRKRNVDGGKKVNPSS